MNVSEKIIRERAFARIAEIFNVPIGLLRQDAKFGEDLKASFVSDFRHNEFDRVDQDIHDVADRKITKELSKGIVIIRTVEEYCDHMVRCHETKPEDVNRILRLL
ncbi:hypothetical protein [Collimonas humicola]|uniref:hypothetical protein n=1 Tax=Collimonas humicola TaxID=2825886 RepID=UPI001B8D6829|nr:hypothetical protein [Collimonas humicola]